MLVTEASSEDNGGGSDPCASTECGSHGVCDNGACACYDGFFGTRVGPRDSLETAQDSVPLGTVCVGASLSLGR